MTGKWTKSSLAVFKGLEERIHLRVSVMEIPKKSQRDASSGIVGVWALLIRLIDKSEATPPICKYGVMTAVSFLQLALMGNGPVRRHTGRAGLPVSAHR